MNCEYVKNYYAVPAEINRRISYRGEGGIIYKDGGNYIAANMDSDAPGVTVNIHPTDPELIYLELGKPRKLTRSQKNYLDYKNSLHFEAGDSFADYMGFKTTTNKGE